MIYLNCETLTGFGSSHVHLIHLCGIIDAKSIFFFSVWGLNVSTYLITHKIHCYSYICKCCLWGLIVILIFVQAIFSDDSDDEEDTSIPNEVGNPEMKVDAANTTLNRLIAGDFLESLGKELGLEVPPELPSSTNKSRTSAPPKETANANSRIYSTYPVEDKPSSTLGEPVNGNLMGARSNSKHAETYLGNQFDNINSEKGPLEDRKFKTPSRRHRSLSSSSSSEDEKSRKRRRHRHRHSDSDSDSSSDHRDRFHSRSKGRKKGSSREKSSSSRKHSKHHKRRSRESPSRYDYSPEKERTETKRDKHKRRD